MRNLPSILVAFFAALMPTLAASQTGNIEGVVRFTNEYPEAETIKTTKDLEVCGLRKTDKTFIVSSENKGLMNAVITLVGGKGEAPALGPAKILQENCSYGPHLQVVAPGTEIEIVNADPVLHNVHAYVENETLFNLAQPKYLKVIKRKLDDPGIVHIKCDVHSWMEAYIVVTDEPFVTLTDEDGRFRIEGVPPGTYQIRLWHEGLGSAEKEVVVTGGQVAEANFEIGE